MGLCYDNLHELDLAEKYFKKSLQSVPTNPDVFNTLGGLYLRTVMGADDMS
jgi:lipoprotein NlpI